MNIGNRIKTLRESAGLSQKELAEILSIQRVSLNYYEMGTRLPKTEVIIAMAKFFGVSADYLLSLDEPQYLGPKTNAIHFTGLPANLITMLHDMKEDHSFTVGAKGKNYILIDIGKKVKK